MMLLFGATMRKTLRHRWPRGFLVAQDQIDFMLPG